MKATMRSLFKKTVKRSRGIVGIEAAIVLIAFVVIAAAMAYVCINMGFFAAQKAKSTIDQGIQEATSGLEIDGFVTGETDLANNSVVVAVQCGNFSLANVYSGVRTSNDSSMTDLMANVTNAPNAMCFLYNSQYSTDTALTQNAKAYLVINLGDTYGLVPYSKVSIEIRTSAGAALLIMREIPGGLPSNTIVDLG